MPHLSPLKLLLLGPQGSGKGTQAQLLSAHYNLPAFSMGQLLREEIARGSAIGKEMEAIMARGDLVPCEYAADVLKVRLERPDTVHGYILDGYPRSMEQLRVFDFDTPTHVFVLDIPRQESIERIAHRLTCDRCGHVYSTFDGFEVGETCKCGGILVHREDDQPEAIIRRLEIFERETKDVIAHYAALGLVHRIDGVGPVSVIHARITEVIGVWGSR